jgi:hypothetical protein
MKALQVLLVLCLLATFSCNDFIDFVLCLVEDPKINEVIVEVINKIKNKASFMEFLTFGIQNIQPIDAAARACLNK